MKNLLIVLSICAFVSSADAVLASTEVTVKNEGIMYSISDKAQDAAETAAENIKTGSKKAGNFIKEKFIIVGEKTAKHAKNGANKAKNATIRGANKVGNTTAKGLKKAGEKIQTSAESAIETTDKNLEKSAPKCKCECKCSENCNCHETEKESQE